MKSMCVAALAQNHGAEAGTHGLIPMRSSQGGDGDADEADENFASKNLAQQVANTFATGGSMRVSVACDLRAKLNECF